MAIHPPGSPRRGERPKAERSGRSRRYHLPAISTGTRATRANLRVAKTDKHGRGYQGRDQHLLGHGFHDSREAERLLLESAGELGLDHRAVELDTRPWLETDINAGFGPS